MNRNTLALLAVGALLLGAALWSRTGEDRESQPPAPEPAPAEAPKLEPAPPAPPQGPELAPTAESGEAWGKHVRKLLGAAHRAQQQAEQREQPPDEAPEPVAEGEAETVDTGWYPDEVHPISREGLDAAMRTAIPGMLRCYQGALEVDPEVSGRIALSMTIAPGDDPQTAQVTNAGIEQSTLGQPFMEACLLQQVQPLAFEPPADGGSLQVTYPVVFEPG